MALRVCCPLGESSLSAVYSQSWPIPNPAASRNSFPRFTNERNCMLHKKFTDLLFVSVVETAG